MRKSFTFFLAILTLSLIVVGCGSKDSSANHNVNNNETGSEPVESITLIANSAWPDSNFHSQGLVEFGEKVFTATDGKLKLDVITGAALGYGGPELLKVVKDGLVPISDIFISSVAGDEPLFGISTLPFLIHDYEEAKIFYEIAQPYFEQVVEEKWNQKILYGALWPYQSFWTKEKVESLDDLKGLKMRTSDEMNALVVETLGGTPYAMPFGELYSALSTGIVDSVITSPPSAVDGKFWEVLDYYTSTNLNAGRNMVTINLDEFNKLDEATKEALIQVGKEMDEMMWDTVINLNKKLEQEVMDNGITILEPSEQFMIDLIAATEDIRTNWLKDAPPEAQEIVDKFSKEVGRN